MNYNDIIDRYYPAGLRLRDIYIAHCRAVANLALDIAARRNLNIPDADIEAAAMLHDIGIFETHAPSINCFGQSPYICHGIIGARILTDIGAPLAWARVAERHTGAGLSVDDIITQNLPLPRRDFIPETTLERLICYADKFYSKSGDMKRKSIDAILDQMRRFGPDSVSRFLSMHSEFTDSRH